MWFKMWHYHRRTYKTHLEEAATVGVLDTVLGFEQGTDRESDLVLGQGSDPESDLVLGLEMEGLQAPVLGPPQGSDQDTGPGKSQAVLGHLGHDQVSGHHQFHPEAGCTVSGTPLKCGHTGKKQNNVSSQFRHKTKHLPPYESPTCPRDGAHLWQGPISPAASTVAATLYFAHQLRVLIGAAAIQHTSVAVPATNI